MTTVREQSPLIVWLTFTIAACGEPLVGARYLGTPALELRGAVTLHGARIPEVHDPATLRLSLFWIGFDSRESSAGRVEQEATLDAALATFDIVVFDEPTSDALRFTDFVDAPEAEVGVALLVLYADNNRNAALNSDYGDPYGSPDTVLGASRSHLVAFARAAPPPGTDAAVLLGDIGPGYHLYENTSNSTCPFVSTRSCVGTGALRRVDPAEATVELILYERPDDVLVPNPAVSSGTSGTGCGNLYNEC